MRIECRITGIDPQPPLFAFFQRVLEHAARRVSVDIAAIDRVIVASPDRFGESVSAIKPGATHTNTETDVAGGKTFPRRDGESVVSDIVLQGSLFGALGEVLADPPTSTQWGVDQQQGLYVICHELGHARDHFDRRDASEAPDPRNGPFSIKATADYYGGIVLTEYAASRIAASVMPPGLFDHETQEAGNRMLGNQGLVSHYLDNPEKLTRRALAHTICQGGWLLMSELARLYGHAAGDPARTEAVRSFENELLDASPLGDALAGFGETYPNWNVPTQIEQLTGIWQQYAATFGVRFVRRDPGPDDFEPLA